MTSGHEKLEAYNTALTYAAMAWHIGRDLSEPHAAIGRRLTNAAHAIALNIALGNGYDDPADRGKAFASARAAVMECAAAQELLETSGAIALSRAGMGKALLARIASGLDSMLDDEARNTAATRLYRMPVSLEDEPRTIDLCELEFYR